MSNDSVNIDRIRRAAVTVTAGDIAMLADAIEFCGSDPGLRDRLRDALDRAYDAYRKQCLMKIIRGLNEFELSFLCDNFGEITKRRYGGRRPFAG